MRLCYFHQVSTKTEWSEQKSVFRILRKGHLKLSCGHLALKKNLDKNDSDQN